MGPYDQQLLRIDTGTAGARLVHHRRSLLVAARNYRRSTAGWEITAEEREAAAAILEVVARRAVDRLAEPSWTLQERQWMPGLLRGMLDAFAHLEPKGPVNEADRFVVDFFLRGLLADPPSAATSPRDARRR